MAYGWLTRATVASSQFLLLRECFRYIGAEKFAAYLALAGAIPWLMLLEFGIGSALQTSLVKPRANGAVGEADAATGIRLLVTTLVAALPAGILLGVQALPFRSRSLAPSDMIATKIYIFGVICTG